MKRTALVISSVLWVMHGNYYESPSVPALWKKKILSLKQSTTRSAHRLRFHSFSLITQKKHYCQKGVEAYRLCDGHAVLYWTQANLQSSLLDFLCPSMLAFRQYNLAEKELGGEYRWNFQKYSELRHIVGYLTWNYELPGLSSCLKVHLCSLVFYLKRR